MMRKWWILLSLILIAVPAAIWAQQGQQNIIYQTGGPFTPGHLLMAASDGLAMDAGGGTTPSLPGRNPSSVFAVGPVCVSDNSKNNPYHQLCIDPNAGGSAAQITYGAFGGATPQGVNCVINGITYLNCLTNGTPVGAVTSVGLAVPSGSLFGVSGSPVTSSGTLNLTTTGTTTGIPYFSSPSQLSSSGALAVGRPILAGAPPTVGTLSGNTTILATTNGSLTNGHCVAIDANGNLVDAGAACSGGGGGSGTVTSVGLAVPGSSIFGVTGSPVTVSGSLGLTTSGTQGGIPYFNSSSTLQSSAALTLNKPVFGSGTSAPFSGTTSGNTTDVATVSGSLSSGNCLMADSNGNVVTTGTPCGSGGGGGISGLTAGQLSIAGSATTLTSSVPFGQTGNSTVLQTDSSGNEKAPINTTTGNFSSQITSTVSTGTAPFSITSTTNVPNLNASSLSGATFASPGSIGSGTPGSGAFTTLSANSTVTTTGLAGGSPASNKWIGLNGSNQLVTGTPGGTVGPGTAGQIPGYASSSSTLTPVTVSGDFTLNGATGVGTLGASGVAAGSYTFTNATIDTKGRITTASSGSFTLSPGLATGSTYNTGSQTATSGSVVSSQLFYEGHATSYVVLTTDGGKLITSTAASLTFTLPNPGAVGSSTFQFGYDGSHAYTLTTVGGTASIYGCVGSGTSVSLSKAVQVVTDGANYQCI